jgi:hypothetical protein
MERTMRFAKGMTFILALTASASLYARDIDFNYVDVNVGIYDLDFDETSTDGVDSLSLETDTDTSFYASGAWQPYLGSVGWFTRVHFFAAASTAKNDLDGSLTFDGVSDTASGDLEVIQARVGVGYHQPLRDNLNVYGRVTWDYIELKDVDLGGANFQDVDESGVGVETGARWLFTERFEVQAYVRWSEDASLKIDSSDQLKTDDDVLGGIAGRWYFADHWALQVDGEFGDTARYGAGVRFTF